FPERFQKPKEVVLAPFSAVPPEQVPSATLNPATLPPLAARVQVPDRSFSAPLSPSPIEIASIQGHKGHLILSLAGVTTPEAAETLRGYWLFVPREKAQRLPRGSYYIYQIVGMGVYTAGGDLVGHVREVLTSAANDVYVVRGPGVTDPTGELLVPAIKAIVQSIDADTRRIVIAPPEEWA
ncbi:MAG TPA: ribosome maturation factor RimM, partial [Chloroflexia bacterium]|nr:ribosome maturation factor RimM [Chloroflexia bacterium]